MSNLSAERRVRLANRRIFFGHQSVGSNIVMGIQEVLSQQPLPGFAVVDKSAANERSGGFFAHCAVGTNHDPEMKTREFAAALDEGLASRLDVAFHKYCYVDFTEHTNVPRLFDAYRAQMATLRRRHEHVTFVHVTVPLTTVQSGPKAMVKKLLGRPPWGYSANLRREQYNNLMRDQYAGREPVFDLAAIEATDPDGRAVTIAFRQESGRTLYEGWTTDGGHLNEAGRRRVAESLLVFLAQLE